MRARGFLLCASSLVGLLLSEGGAAAWLAWTHRTPTLPTTFKAADTTGPTLPTALAGAGRAADEVNIVVIGESSAYGVPYQDYLSVGEIVGWQLRHAIPGRTFRVEVLAQPAAPLEAMSRKLARLTRRPDAMIIYSGHNEFYAYDRWDRSVPYYDDEIDPRSAWSLKERIDHATPLRAMIAEILERKRQEIAPPSMVTRRLIDRPSCTPVEYARRLEAFHARLEEIVAFCERVGCVPILVVPPGNEGGFEPNRSVLARQTTKAERQAIEREFRATRALEATDPVRSRDAYRDLLARQPTFAEAHFRLARLLEASGAWDEANRHYLLARDHDGLPLRCPAPFLDAYRVVADRHRDAILIDGPAVLRALSPHGILDDHVFNDGQHPALGGHIALARAILEQLHARRAFGWPKDAAPPMVDPVECAEHFGMDAAKWATACERSSWFVGMLAYIRFDPTERLAKARRLQEAARRIGAGTPPEAIGIPGIGIRPVAESRRTESRPARVAGRPSSQAPRNPPRPPRH